MNYAERVRQLESEGLSTSDAQAAADAEDLQIGHTPHKVRTYPMLNRRQQRKLVEEGRRYRACKAAHTHPTRSGRRETRLLAGKAVLMERCAVCNILSAADEGCWQ